MSTQHPDNVHMPFFSESPEIGGEDEIKEAYYAFSHLGMDEQMWDCEGKEADNFVVKKLLTNYGDFFRENRIGEDVFITLRVPNPSIERHEAKILIETLESIPRSFDASRLFYQDDTPPIFEVILPMTTSPEGLDRIYRYYRDFVAGKQQMVLDDTGMTVAQWIGRFRPERVNVIPLFEDMDNMLRAHEITRRYLEDKDVEYQRVFLARSDTAMNYGNISAILLNKIALLRLHHLSRDIGIDIYPILGVGSAPFRGNLRPGTADKIVQDYPSVHTYTLQSAFKYDNPPDQVKEGVEKLRRNKTRAPPPMDEEIYLGIIQKYSSEYRKQIMELAPVVNRVAKHVPGRRKRKLHIGLFGYSRSMEGITLPRAITFTAALYSVGIPPELLGFNALDERDLDLVRDTYVHFDDDLRTSLKYYNKRSPFIPEELRRSVESLDGEVDEVHGEVTDQIIGALREERSENIEEYVLRAANMRSFLG